MFRGAAAVLVFVCFALLPQQAAARARTDLVVRARAGASTSELRSNLAARGLSLVARIPHTKLFTVRTNGRGSSSALHMLRSDAQVSAAMRDGVVRAFDTPNDPYFVTAESYLSAVRLPQAWDLSHGSAGVTVAVVDTGVTQVPDLSTQLLPGHSFVPGTADSRDDSMIGHGTLVAGVAAATTNNGVGIAGVAWNADVLPVKVLDEYGDGNDSQVAAGVVWAADHGARVINLSLGGPFSGRALCDAVTYAQAQGALIVAAAGNGAGPALNYPAACPGVLAVSATDAQGNFASFSSFGPDVGLAAPGIAITSTGTDNGYDTESGTSLAAPIVSGVAALVIAQHPDWSAAEVKRRLEETAQDRGPTGRDPYYGYGLLDAYAALGGLVQAPAVPPRDALEPNDDAAHATPLQGKARATISPEGDVDWYVTVLHRAARVRFDVAAAPYNKATATNLLPTARLYDSDLNRLATAVPVDQHARIAARLPAGRYYVRVANGCGARSGGDYTVSVSVHPSRRAGTLLVL